MASAAQTLANRANAQLSTGPRTEIGKDTSSRNAMRHGLTSTQIVMPGEDRAQYDDLQKGMHDSFHPANEVEHVLVNQVAACAWRLMRAQRVETAFLAKLAEGANDPDAAIASAFLDRPKDLDRIQRYVTAAERAYYKAMNELAKLQKERALQERHEATAEACFAPRLPVGSVSQNAKTTASSSLNPAPAAPPSGPVVRPATS